MKLAYLVIILFSTNLWAQSEDWVILEDQDRYKLSQRLKYLEDPSSELTISQVLAFPKDRWTTSNNINTSFGYSQSSYWFYVSFDVRHSALWYVWLRYAPHDDVKFYWVQNDKILQSIQSGDAYPFYSRQVNIAENAIARQLKKGEKVQVYFRVKTEGSYRVPLEMRQRASFEQEHTTVTAFQGIYYGVLLVMTVFNLVLFFITNIRSYLFYVFYVFTSLGSRVTIDGTAFQFLWPSYPILNEWMLPIFFWASGIAFLVFTYTFLNVDKATKKVKWYFLFLSLLGAALGVGVFTLSYHQVVPLTTFYAVLLMFSSLIFSIVMTFSGHKYAGVFAVATIMTALSFSFTVLDSLGFFSEQTLMIYSYPIARMFEIVLFAIALGVRIRFLQNRRLAAEQEAMDNREQAIRNIEQYKRLYESAVTGNFVLNLDGQIQSANNAFYSLMENESAHSKRFMDYFVENKEDVLESLKSHQRSQVNCDCETNSGRWVSVFLNRVSDEEGTRLEGSMVDITDRIHGEKIKQQAEQDKMQALQQLVVGVAHEMNTPLGVVRTSSDYARDTLEKMEEGVEAATITKNDFISLLNSSGEALRLADENMERMTDLIKSFKDVSVEQMQFNTDSLDVEKTIDRLKDSAKEMGVHLECTLEQKNEHGFTTFPEAIYWVLDELMQNTRHHSGGEMLAKLSILLTDESLVIKYSDHGRGVDAEHLTHIFEPFFTTKRGTNRKLGLGLYQVHNIVTQLLKSELNVSNQNGLQFEIHIPNLDSVH